MKKITRYLVLVLIVMVCVGCGKKDNNGKNSDYQDHINIKKLDDIKVDNFISFDNSEIIFKLTNTGKKTYNGLTIKSTYYDKNNEEIGSDEVNVTNLEANKEIYTSQFLPMDENFENYVPERVEIEIVEEPDAPEIGDYMEKLSASYEKGEDDTIDVTIKNDTGVSIGLVDATAVFMKNGKPVSTNYISIINLMEEYVETILVPTTEVDDDGNFEYLDYDDIKIFINNVNPDYESSDETVDLNNEDYTTDDETGE